MFINHKDADELTVPVVVDSVKDTPSYLMTRCTYFSIETKEPSAGWSLNIGNDNTPFIMLGLSGVIISPPGDGPYFDSPMKLESLFELVEENPELYVDTNDIWLPNKLFHWADLKPRRSDVYRINYGLFRAAYLLRDEASTDEEFLAIISQWNIPVEMSISIEETHALTKWNEYQIDAIQKHYHENPERKLQKKQSDEKPLPPLEM